MSYIDDLTTARDNYANILATSGPRDDYSIDGESWTHDKLTQRIKELNDLIAQANPFVVEQQVR